MNKQGVRFAVQILYFDCEQFILRTIANCAPHVEKIFVTYSPQPWSAYNKDARAGYPNPSNPDIIFQSPYANKIELINGVWDTEEEQRNDCLVRAKKEGFDYLIIQDADEFYMPEEYTKNLQGIIANPNFDYYRNPWYFFWKNINTVIVSRYSLTNGTYKPYQKTKIAYNACFAVNCKRDIYFADKRLPNSKQYFMLNGLCLHLSFVMSDDQVKRKLKTWGHSSDFNTEYWYRTKWLGWTKKSKFLHPITSTQWVHTIPFTGDIPKELEGFIPGLQEYQPIGLVLHFKTFFFDCKNFAVELAKDVLHLIKKA
jgi:hypothetical protein